MSKFSEFIRNASLDEKQKMYDKIITLSCIRQRKAAGIPSGSDVIRAHEAQPSNAIGMIK